jgi:hypothetical protein
VFSACSAGPVHFQLLNMCSIFMPEGLLCSAVMFNEK